MCMSWIICILMLCRDPMVRPYQYNLASYVARGGVRCGFISLEVWRQKLHALHSYAFIEVINCRCWWSEVLIQPCMVVREEMVFDILQLLISLSWSITHANWDSIKLLVNSTCDLNSLYKQICLLRCFISLLHYSMQVFDDCQGEWEVAARCTHDYKSTIDNW